MLGGGCWALRRGVTAAERLPAPTARHIAAGKALTRAELQATSLASGRGPARLGWAGLAGHPPFSTGIFAVASDLLRLGAPALDLGQLIFFFASLDLVCVESQGGKMTKKTATSRHSCSFTPVPNGNQRRERRWEVHIPIEIEGCLT